MGVARSTTISFTFKGEDATRLFNDSLDSFSYTDNLDKADNLDIVLSGDKWILDRMIKKGDTISAEIKFDGNILKCGTFKIDEFSLSGVPDKVTLRALSLDLNSKIQGTKKSKSWENTNLKNIANDISKESNLTLFYDTDKEINYNNVEQVDETNISFLDNICKKVGLSLKISSSKIIIFSESKYEEKNASITINKNNLTSYSCNCKDIDTYDSCIVKYFDQELKNIYNVKFTAPNRTDYSIRSERELVVHYDEDVKGDTAVEKEKFLLERAKTLLRDKNKTENTINFKVEHNQTKYRAGKVISITGFGDYSGNYIVTSVVHSYSNKYNVDVSTRKTLLY